MMGLPVIFMYTSLHFQIPSGTQYFIIRKKKEKSLLSSGKDLLTNKNLGAEGWG